MARVDFAAVGAAARRQAAELLRDWFPAGVRRGAEFVVGNLRGDAGESLSVNLHSGKWGEFNGGQSGHDLIGLFAAIHGLSQLDAARELARRLGLDAGDDDGAPPRAPARPPRRPPPPAPPAEGGEVWAVEAPVPGDAGPPPGRHGLFGAPEHVARVLDAEGRLLFAICRFPPHGGRKQIVPLAFGTLDKGDGRGPRRGWHWKAPPAPRPLYGLELLAEGALDELPVLVVEGERKAEAGRRLLGNRAVVVSWPNGAKGVHNADWSALAGRRVLVWPDNDPPGVAAAAKVAELALAAGARGAFALPPPEGVPEAWDLDDAEREGWTGDRVWSHMAAGLDAARAAEAPAAEKRAGKSTKRQGGTSPQRRDDTPTGGGDGGDGGSGWPGSTGAANWLADDAPVRPVGTSRGRYFLFDRKGQLREMGPRELTSRPHLADLCGERDWLKGHYRKPRANGEDGLAVEEAGEDLMFACQTLGLYDPAENPERKPGIWQDEDGRPLVHLGDVLRLPSGGLMPAGRAYAGGVYPRFARMRRPAEAAGPEAARELLAGLESLWEWKEGKSAARLVLGWMGTALLGAAAPWRPNLFVCGVAGTGKSSLIEVVRAGLLVHAYSNDATKAGVEQRVSNRPGPIVIDEAAEADRGERAQQLVAMLRAMTQGAGAQGTRGTSDGTVRTFSVLGAVLLAATIAPAMEAQDAHRLTPIELAKPRPGAPDGAAGMAALTARARALAPSLMGRVLDAFDRWRASLAAFRAALVAAGCAPRQADQLGPQLAGWWVLCFDGVPDAEAAAGSVADVSGYVVTASDAAEDDAPRRAASHLLTSRVSTDRSGERRQVGELIASAFGTEDAEWARRHLRTAGIEASTEPGQRGVWIARRHAELEQLFSGTTFRGFVWAGLLMRLPGAWPLRNKNRRIGGYSGSVMFVPERALRITGDEAAPAPGVAGEDLEATPP